MEPIGDLISVAARFALCTSLFNEDSYCYKIYQDLLEQNQVCSV